MEPWSRQPSAGVGLVLASCVKVHHEEVRLFDWHYFGIHQMSRRIETFNARGRNMHFVSQ